MTKKICAINAGSSSLKCQLFEMPEEKLIMKCLFEKIGQEHSSLTLTYDNQVFKEEHTFNTHQDAISCLLQLMIKLGIVDNLSEISGIGHRVAHGGEFFKASAIVDDRALEEIEALGALAPSHNPVNAKGIRICRELLPNSLQVAVFDTAFHQTLEKEHFLYPIPYEYYKDFSIRKYGFHGTSHQYIYQVLKQQKAYKTVPLKVINCHLGNGCSLCAIKDGKSVNTSMGFTPLAGVMMGSRSGDIDVSILPFLQEKTNMTPQDMLQMLNQQSGLLGISTVSNDIRDILALVEQGDEQACLAIEMFTNRIAQTIASYIVDLGGVDVISFTAGIGENAAYIREKIIQKLACFSIFVDKVANEKNKLFIHAAKSKVKIAIVPTNEELMIVKDTYALLCNVDK
ncbi:acetate kinase [Carnobacteriaceae bacterium zg-ZUI78]|uniref:acetate/propionate family kinase n=1 Tax=Granulicatella sp. zg-84 TaxID=2678503 RepID=UPI0013C10B30|nr:acetate kinase [Granulicatella sp. zg-84]MBS4749721.1 acetate kinase [Carnobacteriaceae bacterium zg-ZUI78]NEW65924.1 acetate/propionate family kinase [Granulicatella sp. zg-84]QMI85151.1 acetate kinase [Carnobacteriaceae bacterium zg-84]